MKKILLLIFALIIVFCLCSCGKDESADTTSETTVAETTFRNEGGSVEKEEFDSAVGTDIKLPEKASNENYYIIQQDSEKFGQVSFKYGKADFVLRVVDSNSFNDISGLYFKWNTNEKCEVNGCEAEVHLYKTKNDSCSVIIWFDSDNAVMYSLSTDCALKEETLIKIAAEI